MTTIVEMTGNSVQMFGELLDGTGTLLLLTGIGGTFNLASGSTLYSDKGCGNGTFERLGGGFTTRPLEARLNLTTVLELGIGMTGTLLCATFEPTRLSTWSFNGTPIRLLPFEGDRFVYDPGHLVIRRYARGR